MDEGGATGGTDTGLPGIGIGAVFTCGAMLCEGGGGGALGGGNDGGAFDGRMNAFDGGGGGGADPRGAELGAGMGGAARPISVDFGLIDGVDAAAAATGGASGVPAAGRGRCSAFDSSSPGALSKMCVASSSSSQSMSRLDFAVTGGGGAADGRIEPTPDEVLTSRGGATDARCGGGTTCGSDARPGGGGGALRGVEPGGGVAMRIGPAAGAALAAPGGDAAGGRPTSVLLPEIVLHDHRRRLAARRRRG